MALFDLIHRWVLRILRPWAGALTALALGALNPTQADTVTTVGGAQISTTVTETASGARFQVSITPLSAEADSTQKIYYAVALPSGLMLFYSRSGWTPWTPGSALPALYEHAQTECRQGASFGYHVDVPPLSQLAQMGLRGASFYAGYGDTEADLLGQQKYALIYTVR